MEGDAGCSTLQRPDFTYDCLSHVVIVEVDEHQHTNYKEGCDCVRVFNLNETLMRPTVIVRYNPDAFKANGRKMNPNVVAENTLETNPE